MSLERPWEKPFGVLTEELQSHWGHDKSGTGDTPNKVLDPSDRVNIWAYPAFSGFRGEDRVVVTVSESPVGCADPLDMADNCEFLQISLLRKLEVHLVLRHEGFFDRLKKAIKFEWEHQTGNAEFDRKYFIISAPSDRDRRLVGNPEFQRPLEALEPFVSIALLESGAHYSREIRDKSDLSFDKIEASLGHLEALLDLAGK